MDILNKFAIVAIKPTAPRSTQFEAITVGYYVKVYRNYKFHHGTIAITGNTEMPSGEQPLTFVSEIKAMKVMREGHALSKVKKALGWDNKALNHPHVCKIPVDDFPIEVCEYLRQNGY